MIFIPCHTLTSMIQELYKIAHFNVVSFHFNSLNSKINKAKVFK